MAHHSSAISGSTSVIPCSGVGRKHILQGVSGNVGWALLGTVLLEPQAHHYS
ncbi:hypothetical protein I79_023451 [Cricetulus griseus]|uniref:Uncharacterized protein n=1 Tax=Cricetulus griseus TaxID=10029 RepID=G3IHZ1_CRIGR|nr:hypothetical protein I79_023451 [Cricetulus griseus]